MLLKMRTIADRIKERMAELGLTAYRVAKDSGIATSNLSEMLSGKKHPTSAVLTKLAPVLGIPLTQLQAWADEDLLGEERLGGLSEYVLGKRAKAEAYAKVFRVFQQQIKGLPEDTPEAARFAMLQFSIAVQHEVQALYEEVDREIRSQEGG